MHPLMSDKFEAVLVQQTCWRRLNHGADPIVVANYLATHSAF
jgi:hypothetical protein